MSRTSLSRLCGEVHGVLEALTIDAEERGGIRWEAERNTLTEVCFALARISDNQEIIATRLLNRDSEWEERGLRKDESWVAMPLSLIEAAAAALRAAPSGPTREQVEALRKTGRIPPGAPCRWGGYNEALDDVLALFPVPAKQHP